MLKFHLVNMSMPVDCFTKQSVEGIDFIIHLVKNVQCVPRNCRDISTGKGNSHDNENEGIGEHMRAAE